MKSIDSQQPSGKLPVYIIGAGSIVNDAHLPAYRIAGFNVQGIYDIDESRAKNTADKFNIPFVFKSMQQLVSQAPDKAVFDVAVPGSDHISILEKLPEQSNVLLQKPMGENYEEAKRILTLTKEKRMNAGVNFQLRYAPFITALRHMIIKGELGDLVDIEININVYTPWQTWDFLFSALRVEILYHSIHYIDLVRTFFGNPDSVYAKTVKHPATKELASVKSNIILDYGDMKRASILTNHCHVYGESQQQSYLKFEGTNGAVKIDIGLLKNYPAGGNDKFEYILREDGVYHQWQTRDIEGTWFPHAFIGSMAQVMLAAENKISKPDNSVDDAIHTMACVEAAYRSSEQGGVKPNML